MRSPRASHSQSSSPTSRFLRTARGARPGSSEIAQAYDDATPTTQKGDASLRRPSRTVDRFTLLRAGRPRAMKIEAIELHHLGPRFDEVLHELLLGVGRAVHFGKRTQLTREHFAGFEAFFGPDPHGNNSEYRHSLESGDPETARFRTFTREQIAERGDSLDIAWLKDDSIDNHDDLPEPALLAQEAIDELQGALLELQGILEELGETVDEVEE